MIRKDASIVISIYNKNTYATEYWRGYQKAEGEWEWRFLTELNDYLYSYELGYNTNGIYIMGEFPTVINGRKSETVCIDDSGTITTPKLPLYRQILAEDGYYLCEHVLIVVAMSLFYQYAEGCEEDKQEEQFRIYLP